MPNLWIGRPGSLTEIDQAAKSFDRTADLGVSEFKSLGGRVTVTRHQSPVRRLKLAWDLLPPAPARALDRIARRIDSPGPVFVIDPAAGNVLAPAQAAGLGTPGATDITGLAQWFVASATGTLTETAPGTPGVFAFTAPDTAAALAWRCTGTVGNFPVAPGLPLSFRAPTALAALPTVTVGIDFKRLDGTYLGSSTTTGPAVTATVPSGAAYATPTARPGTPGTYSLAGACLAFGGTATAGVPGDGLPPMSVIAYSDAPGRPLPYRSISLDLVEVSGATG
ncbi:hypothetical protein AB0O01_13025 [Streptomyces sp. NPDC093252]|uniref:hypothetical protein n=1 Tax=Streptomyces sp. NPDC093252 TaxID=3154980 RepID=UPI003446B3A3